MRGLIILYKWDPSFIDEDIYVSFGTNGNPYLTSELAVLYIYECAACGIYIHCTMPGSHI